MCPEPSNLNLDSRFRLKDTGYMPPECAVKAQNERVSAQFKIPGAIGRKAIRLLGLLVWLSVSG